MPLRTEILAERCGAGETQLCCARNRFTIEAAGHQASCASAERPHMKPGWSLMTTASALVALSTCCPAHAQDSHAAPCPTSVVLKACPDRLPVPFQSDADRSDAAQRQQMQDQFASTEQQGARRAAQAETDLDRVTIYGQQQAPSTPMLVQFGQDVAKSGPKDCRDAYATSGARGRFGVYDLLRDTLTGKSCSWK